MVLLRLKSTVISEGWDPFLPVVVVSLYFGLHRNNDQHVLWG